MFSALVNAWKIPELRKKILFTLMIIVLYRLGSSIPMPWISPDLMEGGFMTNGALGWLNLLSGGALALLTVASRPTRSALLFTSTTTTS